LSVWRRLALLIPGLLLVSFAVLLLTGRGAAGTSAAPLSSAKPAGTSWGSSLYVLRVPTINTVQNGVLVMEGAPRRIVEQPPSDCGGGADINARHKSLEQLLSKACLFGPRCLVFEGLAAPAGCSADRIEVDVASANEDGLRYGESGELSFYLKVDPDVVDLPEPALISQTWQFASVAIGKRPALGPAFSIALISNQRDRDLVDVQFRYRNVVGPRDGAHLFLVHPLRKGEWHKFAIHMTPRYDGHPDGRGEILVWVDPAPGGPLELTRALNYDANDDGSYRFYWGYPPDPETRLESAFDVRVGIYRPEPLTWLKFWLDGVRLTRHKVDLKP
jgi:hypothetical protein